MGEFERRIKAFDREVKQKFWAQGMLNTVKEAQREFPFTFDENWGIPVGDYLLLKQWFERWFGSGVEK